MSTFVYSRDIERIMHARETASALAPHYERVAPGVDVLAPALTEEQLMTEAHIVSTAFSSSFYTGIQRDLIMGSYREPTNRRYHGTKHIFYNDSHGPRGRKRTKPRQLTGSQHRVLH